MTPRPPVWKIALILGIGTLCASTAAIFIRLALDVSGVRGAGFSLVLAASRLTIAAVALIPAWQSFRGVQFQPKAIVYSVVAGVFLAIHFAAWITSLSYTSVAASTSLVTTNPVWVALLSWIWFKEKPSIRTALGIGLAIAGSLIISLGGEANNVGLNPPLGNFLALLGAWVVSFHMLLGREAQRCGLSVMHHVTVTYSTAAIVLLPLPLLFQTSYTGYPSQVYLYIFLMALFPQLIGHTSFNWALRWISPTLVALTILAEPIGSGILAFLLFQENPGLRVILGTGVILSGVAIAAIGAKSPNPA